MRIFLSVKNVHCIITVDFEKETLIELYISWTVVLFDCERLLVSGLKLMLNADHSAKRRWSQIRDVVAKLQWWCRFLCFFFFFFFSALLVISGSSKEWMISYNWLFLEQKIREKMQHYKNEKWHKGKLNIKAKDACIKLIYCRNLHVHHLTGKIWQN